MNKHAYRLVVSAFAEDVRLAHAEVPFDLAPIGLALHNDLAPGLSGLELALVGASTTTITANETRNTTSCSKQKHKQRATRCRELATPAASVRHLAVQFPGGKASEARRFRSARETFEGKDCKRGREV